MAHNIKKGNHVTLKGMNCDSFSLVLHLELALSDTQATRRKGLIEANSFGRPKKKNSLSVSFRASKIVNLIRNRYCLAADVLRAQRRCVTKAQWRVRTSEEVVPQVSFLV